MYEQALSLLEEGDATRAMIHSNRAACYSKMGAYADVVSEASQSLRVDAKSHKAYWHRAQAYLHLGQVAKAKEDLQNVLALDGSHTEAQETLDSLNGVQKPSAPAGLGGMNLKPSSKKSAAGGDKKKAASSTEGVSAAGQAAASAAQTYKEQPSATGTIFACLACTRTSGSRIWWRASPPSLPPLLNFPSSTRTKRA